MGTKNYFNGIQPADTGVNNTFYNTQKKYGLGRYEPAFEIITRDISFQPGTTRTLSTQFPGTSTTLSINSVPKQTF